MAEKAEYNIYTADEIFNLELGSYDIEKANVELFKKLVRDKPNLKGYDEYGRYLGMSGRTLYRFIIKHDLTDFFAQRKLKMREPTMKVQKSGKNRLELLNDVLVATERLKESYRQ